MNNCPLCLIMAEDYHTALAEAGHASHQDEAELLLDYAEAVGRALSDHLNTHLDTPPSRSKSAPERPTVDGGSK